MYVYLFHHLSATNYISIAYMALKIYNIYSFHTK